MNFCVKLYHKYLLLKKPKLGCYELNKILVTHHQQFETIKSNELKQQMQRTIH